MSHALILFALTLTGADGPPQLTPTPTPEPIAPCPAPVARTTSPETWKLTLRNAIRIGFDNSEAVRLIESGATGIGGATLRCEEEEWDRPPLTQQIVIAPVPTDAAAETGRFKAEVMALVRSIGQQYWSLVQQFAQREATEKAVHLAEEILKREQYDLTNKPADLAEIQQRLAQFRLDLVSKQSDIITTERQLRNLLGLPPADNRRIVPVSAPTEAKVEPDWKSCLATMMDQQPDIVRQKAIVELVEKRLGEAESTVALASRLGVENEAPTPSEVRVARFRVQRNRSFLTQILNQTTNSLARFFHEIDANYQQFQTASRFRAAAAQRLEVQRVFYEEGRITIDRYLDAVSQYAGAIAQETQFKAAYNVSLIALEEAKGTLLAYNKIVVADPPRPKADPTTRDDAAKAASFESTPGKAPEPAQAKETGKTVSFQFTVGAGARPMEVRGSFTVTPTGQPSGR